MKPQNMGSRAWSVEFRVEGFQTTGLGFRIRASNLVSRTEGLFRVRGVRLIT